LQFAKRVVQLAQIRVDTVETWAPFAIRLSCGESQHGEIARSGVAVREAWKTLPKKSNRMLADDPLALVERKHRSQHPLVFGVWLAKVEVRHNEEIIGRTAENFDSTKVLFCM
jgi:hypothetical protein